MQLTKKYLTKKKEGNVGFRMNPDKMYEWFKVWRDFPPRLPRPPAGPVPGAAYTCRQIVSAFAISTNLSGGKITQNSAVALLGGVAFSVQDLGQITTFSSLFDQYRVESLRFRIRSNNPALNLASIASPNNTLPRLYVVVDRDDSSPVAGTNDLRQYNNCVELAASDSIDLELVPSVTPGIFASSAFSGYSTVNSNQIWLDIANTAIPHYGMKFGVSPLHVSATYSYTWDVECYVVVSFRATR